MLRIKNSKLKSYILALICFPLLFSLADKPVVKNGSQNNYVDFSQGNRTCAEWEPALGTLIVWPLSLPYKLVVELANDNHLYTMIENEGSKKEAKKWFSRWGIDSADVTFVFAKQGVDAWWTRDWGPSAVFTKDGHYKLADGKYPFATPVTDLDCNDSLRFQYYNADHNFTKTKSDDSASIYLSQQLGYNILDLPFINTGGNVLTDGLGTAFSSCVLSAENKVFGLSRNEFLQKNHSLLGFKNYHLISNFEKYGMQHIDCFMKLIDEETILVANPPKDHESYSIYENIINNELSKLKTAYGRPYTILRMETARYEGERLAAYTNSLILNKTVYVPLFGINKNDSIALKIWETIMPGYTIKGFDFSLKDEPLVSKKVKEHYVNYGWNSSDALHCRTRAIWNPEMLFISVKKIHSIVEYGITSTLYASIIDYSGKGLDKSHLNLYWRVKNSDKWNAQTLNSTGNTAQYFASIPPQTENTIVEYYIQAVSKSGTISRKPITAPGGFYAFKTVGNTEIVSDKQ